MKQLVLWAFVALWAVCLCRLSPVETGFESLPRLYVRQGSSDDPTDGEGVQACPLFMQCSACQSGGSCSGSVNSKRELYGSRWNSSGETWANLLGKRTLGPVNIRDIRQYISDQTSNNPYQDILPEDVTNGVVTAEYTGFVQRSFANFLNPKNGKLVIGVNPGFLSGCSMLAVVSRRAVWMGHIWQNLGFTDAPPEETDPNVYDPMNNPLLTENLLNFINNVQPQTNVRGDTIDVSMFNQPGDNTFVFLMTPVHAAPTTRAAARLGNVQGSPFFPNAIQQIADTLNTRLGTGTVVKFIAKGYASLSAGAYPANEPWRAAAFFEYDPNADGNGNGDWRLFYEQTVYTGRAAVDDGGCDQVVVGNNQQT